MENNSCFFIGRKYLYNSNAEQIIRCMDLNVLNIMLNIYVKYLRLGKTGCTLYRIKDLHIKGVICKKNESF